MALTSTQKQSIRLYLGWTGRWHQVQTEMEQCLNAVDAAADADLEAQVVVILAQLAAVDKQLFGTGSSDYADGSKKRQKFTRVEDVWFATGAERASLQAEGRILVGRLSALLGIAPKQDVFSPRANAAGQFFFGGSTGTLDSYLKHG